MQKKKRSKEGRDLALRGMERLERCVHSIREQRPETSKVMHLTSCKVRGVFKQKRLLGFGKNFARGCGVRDVWNNHKQELLCPY